MSPKGYKYEASGEAAETPEVPTKQEMKETPSPETPQTFVVKTELDAYINERLQTQPRTLEEIEVREIRPPQDGTHALTLPKEIKDALTARGLTAFWINKKKKAIDRALNDRGWTLFNRVYFPGLSKHLFTANGTVEAGDSILGFMPARNAEILRRLPGKLSQERIKSLPMERFKDSAGEEKIGYYKPTYEGEREGEMVKTGRGLFAQPDLPNETE